MKRLCLPFCGRRTVARTRRPAGSISRCFGNHRGTMKALAVAILSPLLLAGCISLNPRGASPTGPALARTSVLPEVTVRRTNAGVPGRIDHMAYDPATRRLFAAAGENGSLEVVDLETGQRLRSFMGLPRPQGAALVPPASCAAVACVGEGAIRPPEMPRHP